MHVGKFRDIILVKKKNEINHHVHSVFEIMKFTVEINIFINVKS